MTGGAITLTIGSYLFGFIVLFMFSKSFFNKPKYSFRENEVFENGGKSAILEPALPKHMTSKSQYRFYFSLFVCLVWSFYLLLSQFLPYLYKYIGLSISGGPGPTEAFNAFMAALVIAGLFAKLPFVQGLLSIFRNWCHVKANIPSEGRILFSDLKREIPQYDLEILHELMENLDTRPWYETVSSDMAERARNHLQECDFEPEAAKSASGRWALLSYLLFIIHKWSVSSPLRAVITLPDLRWGDIRESYGKTAESMTCYRKGTLSQQEAEKIPEELSRLLDSCFQFITCMLLIAAPDPARMNKF
ncbi:MAG: hypothetical protein ACE5FU_06110, partial [Nitrospinota bacterium]